MRFVSLYGWSPPTNVLFHATATFIQKHGNSGVHCVSACESVTASYLNTNQDPTNQDLPTKITDQDTAKRAPRPPTAPEDCTHGQCPQDPDRGRRYRSARYAGGAIVAARRVRSFRCRYRRQRRQRR